MKDTCKKFLDETRECECRDADCFCVKLFKLDQLYNLSALSMRQRRRVQLRVDADGTDRDEFLQLKSVEENILQFVQRGDNLYIYSEQVGNGKSTWSIRLLQSYLNAIWHKCDISCKVLFVSVPRYLLAIKDNITNSNEYAIFINEHILEADIVVFDDIATKTATQFEHENLFNIIDTRINEGKSCIFTSNLTYDGLVASIGPRIASRIFNTSVAIQLHGVDKRSLGGNVL